MDGVSARRRNGWNGAISGLTVLLAIPLLSGAVAYAPWQAFMRMAVAIAVCVVIPGWTIAGLCKLWRPRDSGLERCAVALAMGYMALTVISGIVPLMSLSLDAAAWGLVVADTALVIAYATLSISPADRGEAPPRDLLTIGLPLMALILAYAWRFGATIQGEEVVELATIWKFLENPEITLSNAGQVDGQILTYILAPHQFLIALVAKISGMAPVPVYSGLRVAFVAAAMVAFWALARTLLGGRTSAWFAVVMVSALLVIDPDPWSWPASQFALVRRGAFAAGVLLVLNGALAHKILSEPERPWGHVFVPVGLLAATLVTHALEAAFTIWMFGGLFLHRLLWRREDWRRAAFLLVVAIAVVLVYRVVHGQLLPEIAVYEAARGSRAPPDFSAYLAAPWRAVLGGVSPSGQYFFVNASAPTPWALLPVVLLPLMIMTRLPMAKNYLAVVVAPTILLAAPLGYAVMAMASTAEISFATAYFAPLGLVATAAILMRLGEWIGGSVRWRLPLVAGLTVAVAWLSMSAVGRWPSTPAWACLVALAIGWRHRVDAGAPSEDGSTVRGRLHALVIAVILFGVMKHYPGAIEGSRRDSLPTQWLARWDEPSVRDEGSYHSLLVSTMRPKLSLSGDSLDRLRARIPVGSRVAFDPEQSYGLPALLPVYVVNSDIFLSSLLDYIQRHVRTSPAGRSIHPLYNANPALTEQDACFLGAYATDFILASAVRADTVASKLSALGGSIRETWRLDDGLTVWAIDREQMRLDAGALCPSVGDQRGG